MKILKRLLMFFSIFLVYIILKEFLQLYAYARAIHPVAGYVTLIAIAAFTVYFVGIPVVRILKLPQSYAPTKDPDKIPEIIAARFKLLKTNPVLTAEDIDLEEVPRDREGYYQLIEALKPRAQEIRKKYVTQVFYSTAIAQNGFLDAVLILSASVNMIKEFFLLYQGRVANRDLWKIARMVYYSMAIGGSESVEYAADEVVSKLFSGGMQGVPFASKILGSLADGFVNAALVTRISIITDNYCKFVFIDSEKALYPSYKTVIATTRILTSDIIDRILQEVKHMARDKSSQILDLTIHPVKYVLDKALGRKDGNAPPPEYLTESTNLVYNPIGYTFGKLGGLFRK